MYVHIKYIYACSNMLLKRKQASSVKQMEEEEEKMKHNFVSSRNVYLIDLD